MFTRPFVRSLTILGLSLVTTSAAYARNPPALVRSQEAYAHAAAGSGYRDSLARAGDRERGVQTSHAATGYRDALTRFARSTPARIASNR
jgi:hypothetical protein